MRYSPSCFPLPLLLLGMDKTDRRTDRQAYTAGNGMILYCTVPFSSVGSGVVLVFVSFVSAAGERERRTDRLPRLEATPRQRRECYSAAPVPVL